MHGLAGGVGETQGDPLWPRLPEYSEEQEAWKALGMREAECLGAGLPFPEHPSGIFQIASFLKGIILLPAAVILRKQGLVQKLWGQVPHGSCMRRVQRAEGGRGAAPSHMQRSSAEHPSRPPVRLCHWA